jgi:hypothetical protein
MDEAVDGCQRHGLVTYDVVPMFHGDYMSGALSSPISGRFLPCFCAFFCSTAPQAFFRPDRRFRTPARAEAVKVGRRSAIEAHFDVSRPRLDSFEHGGGLDGYGPEERSVVEFFLPLLCLLRDACRLRVQRQCPCRVR